MRLNRSPNRREESSPAQRCNLVCILRTARRRLRMGHCTVLVFTSTSSDIAFPSLSDTLPPFPMYAVFPRSEYYGGSVPFAPSADVVPIARRHPWTRRRPGTDHGWFPRSLLTGRRVRHPALPLRHRHGYAVDIHVASEPRPLTPSPDLPARNGRRVRVR